ncbi:unnamed protein product [Amoebophrya sp. A25]|nr:unnamed protein product [Amoebophrya sp. A25]|eukprot:GSA25T00002910001.1
MVRGRERSLRRSRHRGKDNHSPTARDRDRSANRENTRSANRENTRSWNREANKENAHPPPVKDNRYHDNTSTGLSSSANTSSTKDTTSKDTSAAADRFATSNEKDYKDKENKEPSSSTSTSKDHIKSSHRRGESGRRGRSRSRRPRQPEADKRDYASSAYVKNNPYNNTTSAEGLCPASSPSTRAASSGGSDQQELRGDAPLQNEDAAAPPPPEDGSRARGRARSSRARDRAPRRSRERRRENSNDRDNRDPKPNQQSSGNSRRRRRGREFAFEDAIPASSEPTSSKDSTKEVGTEVGTMGNKSSSLGGTSQAASSSSVKATDSETKKTQRQPVARRVKGWRLGGQPKVEMRHILDFLKRCGVTGDDEAKVRRELKGLGNNELLRLLAEGDIENARNPTAVCIARLRKAKKAEAAKKGIPRVEWLLVEQNIDPEQWVREFVDEEKIAAFCRENTIFQDKVFEDSLLGMPDGILELIKARAYEWEKCNDVDDFLDLLDTWKGEVDFVRKCELRAFWRDQCQGFPEELRVRFFKCNFQRQVMLRGCWMKDGAMNEEQVDYLVGMDFPSVEDFAEANDLDSGATNRLKQAPEEIQRQVLDEGLLIGARNTSSCLVSRILHLDAEYKKRKELTDQETMYQNTYYSDQNRKRSTSTEQAWDPSQVQRFLDDNCIDNIAREIFWEHLTDTQRAEAVQVGEVDRNGTNPSAVLMGRLGKVTGRGRDIVDEYWNRKNGTANVNPTIAAMTNAKERHIEEDLLQQIDEFCKVNKLNDSVRRKLIDSPDGTIEAITADGLHNADTNCTGSELILRRIDELGRRLPHLADVRVFLRDNSVDDRAAEMFLGCLDWQQREIILNARTTDLTRMRNPSSWVVTAIVQVRKRPRPEHRGRNFNNLLLKGDQVTSSFSSGDKSSNSGGNGGSAISSAQGSPNLTPSPATSK